MSRKNNKEKKSVHCWQCKAVFKRITGVESHARALGHRWREPTQRTIYQINVQSVDHWHLVASIFHALATPRLNSATHPKPPTTLSKRNSPSGSGHDNLTPRKQDEASESGGRIPTASSTRGSARMASAASGYVRRSTSAAAPELEDQAGGSQSVRAHCSGTPGSSGMEIMTVPRDLEALSSVSRSVPAPVESGIAENAEQRNAEAVSYTSIFVVDAASNTPGLISTRMSLQSPPTESNVPDAPSIVIDSDSDSSVGINLDVSSEPAPLSVSGVPACIDSAAAGEVQYSDDSDDFASAVSYASVAEVTETGAVDPALTSMESSKTLTDSQTSLYYDAESASVPSSPHSPISTLSMEGRGAAAALQLVEGPSDVAEKTFEPGYPSSPRVWPATPSIPDFLSGCSSARAMPSRFEYIVVPGSRDIATSTQVARNTTTAAQRGVTCGCKSCQRDTCDSPVETICGHVFCQSCICQELSAHGCCPVCRRVMLLRLDVAV